MPLGALRTAACLLAAAGVLAGCDSGGSATATARTTSTRADSHLVQGFHVLALIDVHETEFSISPKRVGLERTAYFGLRVFNDGKTEHALAVSGPGVSQRTGTIEPGESVRLAVFFRKPGVYKLFCPIDDHEQRGMTAVIRVR